MTAREGDRVREQCDRYHMIYTMQHDERQRPRNRRYLRRGELDFAAILPGQSVTRWAADMGSFAPCM
jgi:hypothetical protein